MPSGKVTGVIDGNGGPDVVNVNTGGPDGINALWDRPGSLRAGDIVWIVQYGAVWVVAACTSRKVIPDVPVPLLDFMTMAPPDGKQISTLWRRDDATAAKPHVTLVYSDGAPPVIPPGGNTQSFTASASGTYDSLNNWRGGVVRQGTPPGYSFACSGLWIMPTSIVAALAGATLTGCTASVRRVNGMGAGGPVDLNVYQHAYATTPTGPPSMVSVGTVGGAPQGAVATFPVPLSVAQLLQAGTVTGLGIAGGGYCGYEPGLTLTFNY